VRIFRLYCEEVIAVQAGNFSGFVFVFVFIFAAARQTGFPGLLSFIASPEKIRQRTAAVLYLNCIFMNLREYIKKTASSRHK